MRSQPKMHTLYQIYKIFDALLGSFTYSVMDLKSAYFQVDLAEDCRDNQDSIYITQGAVSIQLYAAGTVQFSRGVM